MTPKIFSVCFTVLAFAFFTACGASRQTTDEEVNIDELLGEETQESGGSDQDEVLRLLGITQSEEASAQPADFSQMEEQSSSQMAEMEAEVDELRRELLEKDRQINSLQSELVQKEGRISELQSKTSRRTPIAGRTGSPSPDFRARYQAALTSFNSRDYQNTISVLRSLLSEDANNSLSDNCQYWIGESFYGLQNYQQAIAEFEKVFSFPNSNKADDAQLMLGLCHWRLGDRGQARSEFDSLLSTYPESEYAAVAQRYLSRI